MKRFLYIITVFIFCFSLSFCNVFASSTHGGGGGSHAMKDPTGFDSWSFTDKVSFITDNSLYVIGAIIGLGNGNAEGFKEAMSNVYRDSYYINDYATYGEFLADKLSFNDDTQTWSYDDDVKEFLNAVKTEMENSITYVNFYLPGSRFMPVSFFVSQSAYTDVKRLIEGHPGQMVNISSGGSIKVPDTDTYVRCATVLIADVPYCGVNSSIEHNVGWSRSTLYNDQWQKNIKWAKAYIYDDAEHTGMVYKDANGEFVEVLGDGDIYNLDLSLICEYETRSFSAWMAPSAKIFAESDYPDASGWGIFSDYTGAIPVFVSETEMKKGTASGVQGQFMPGYTPGEIADNSITQTEINDFSTNYNYYYGDSSGGGSGSGSGGSSGDSGGSSGGFLDGLLNFIGGIGDGILSVLGKLLSFLNDAVSLVFDTFNDILDLFSNGFVNFIAALFPFIPDEWVTAITLALCLSVLGVIIRIFTG